jgi:predicted Fe-Mo cluster-binding NifX family protein
MNICMPVTEDRGLESPLSLHFGSAPVFLLVDTATLTCRALPNRNAHHAHGMCQPLAALAGEAVDGLVVGGIGQGALMKLQAAGIEVFRCDLSTVSEALAALAAGRLRQVSLEHACEHQGHGPGSHGAHGRGRA